MAQRNGMALGSGTDLKQFDEQKQAVNIGQDDIGQDDIDADEDSTWDQMKYSEETEDQIDIWEYIWDLRDRTNRTCSLCSSSSDVFLRKEEDPRDLGEHMSKKNSDVRAELRLDGLPWLLKQLQIQRGGQNGDSDSEETVALGTSEVYMPQQGSLGGEVLTDLKSPRQV
ncbi:hypothetical protein N7471_013431 [Penicillium samsonianum]|uniref:uncharacterized protein n=1 Tax=Penicillium samsonianum TaxID=1882272 RepID=UPI002548544D|nr:uncharacterized protein N7471_013431 [Penicillium samsonianum]KAJ6118811.1 hypothetical protein N7471_013431 [Penicillium samsonianum]